MSVWFPFISLLSHREVVAAKDETIRVQAETIKQLTDSLAAFRETMTAVRTAAAATPIRRPRPQEERAAEPRIDYLAIDPDDNKALADAAARELGPGRHTATMLTRRVESIRQQIIASRSAQAGRSPISIPAPPPPDDINELINQAEQQGIAAAAEVM